MSETLNTADFDITTPEDEVNADRLCQDLLLQFYNRLLQEGVSPEQASAFAGSADYYLRDYLVSIRQKNLFQQEEGLIRQFAGNWYIVSTMEPNVKELANHLDGIMEFYRYLARRELIDIKFLENVEQECSDLSYYDGRIESFWNISGDGYACWEKECSLKI